MFEFGAVGSAAEIEIAGDVFSGNGSRKRKDSTHGLHAEDNLAARPEVLKAKLDLGVQPCKRMNLKKKAEDGRIMFGNDRFGQALPMKIKIFRVDAQAVAETALKALLSQRRLSAEASMPPSRSRYFSVEAVSRSGGWNVIGIGLSRRHVFTGAFGYEA